MARSPGGYSLHIRSKAGHRGVKGYFSIEIWQPVQVQQATKMFPRSGVESKPRGIRQVTRRADALLVGQRHGTVFHIAAHDFARGVEKQRVPEVSGYRLVSLSEFAGDRRGDGARECVGRFVE